MRVPTWLWLALVMLALSVALFLAPGTFEGPTLVLLDRRHAVTGMDLVALLPLLGGAFMFLAGKGQSARLAAPQHVPGIYLFVAGLAMGLAAAARFPYLPFHWPVAVILLGFLILAAFAHMWRS